MTERDTLLSVQHLEVYYGGIHALHDISLNIAKGSIVSIIGANGAGKSTLLRAIAGDKSIKSGTVIFDGKPLPEKSYLTTAMGVCLVPEGRRVFPDLTVRDNLRIGAFLEKNKVEIQRRYEEVFELFPRLKERINQMGGTLSGGEQQMLAIGRALMAKPRLLMLDEPSLGLAPIVVDEIFEKFRQINRDMGVTILVVEQNAYIALEVAVYSYIISLGRVSMEGESHRLLEDPTVQQAYMGVK